MHGIAVTVIVSWFDTQCNARTSVLYYMFCNKLWVFYTKKCCTTGHEAQISVIGEDESFVIKPQFGAHIVDKIGMGFPHKFLYGCIPVCIKVQRVSVFPCRVCVIDGKCKTGIRMAVFVIRKPSVKFTEQILRRFDKFRQIYAITSLWFLHQHRAAWVPAGAAS